MTFEVKQSITFVATHPLVILTKFGRNLIKHVEEEANCEKEEEEERKKLETAPFAKGTGKVRRMEEVTAFLVKKNLLTPVIPNRNLSQ